MSSLSKKYWEALGISYDKSKAALDRAHEIRKFEIELYWKRATYFWALQLAAFTGFGVLWHEAHLSSRLLALLFTAVGAATAHAGWLSVRGPKFWQENWEKHIDCLEVRFEGNLHNHMAWTERCSVLSVPPKRAPKPNPVHILVRHLIGYERVHSLHRSKIIISTGTVARFYRGTSHRRCCPHCCSSFSFLHTVNTGGHDLRRGRRRLATVSS